MILPGCSEVCKQHMDIHTGEKTHQCRQCDKTFNRNSYLKRHILTHTGEKLYKCSQCDKTFISNNNLKYTF